jgi:excisionase family DNA binding protein
MRRRDSDRNSLGTTISNSKPRQRRKRPEDLARSSPAVIEDGAETDYHPVAPENDDRAAAVSPMSDVPALAADSVAWSRGTGVGGATSTRRPRRAAPGRRQRGEKENAAPRSKTRRGSHVGKNERGAPRTKPAVQGPWLTVAAAAVYLAMTERAVRDLWYRGILPGHRMGGVIRFSQPELDNFLRVRRESTDEEVALGTQGISASPALLGPFLNPEAAASYLGLPSDKALLQRVRRRQVPVYRISERILRFRPAELDALLTEKRLTVCIEKPILENDACLPGPERR